MRPTAHTPSLPPAWAEAEAAALAGRAEIERGVLVPTPDQVTTATYWARMTMLAALNGPAGERVGVARVDFCDGVAHDWHVHVAHGEVVLVLAGAIDQFLDGRPAGRLEVGQAAVIPAGVVHRAVPLVPDTAVLIVLVGPTHGYSSQELSAGGCG